MNEYAYQIQGALETAEGKLKGFRVLVCNAHYLTTVDVPSTILDTETAKFLEFRLRMSPTINIQRLPYDIQTQIRTPLGRWLDEWVLENFYGDTSKPKSINS